MRWIVEGQRKRSEGGVTERESARLPGEESVVGRVQEKLAAMQLTVPERPRKKDGSLLDPQLPPDLTTLNDVQIGRLFTQFCLMAQYVQLQLAVWTVEKTVAKQAEKYVRAETRLRKDGTVSERDAATEVDKRVRDRTMKTLTSEGVETMTNAMMQRYIIGRDAISREMTRRSWMMRDPSPSR